MVCIKGFSGIYGALFLLWCIRGWCLADVCSVFYAITHNGWN
jgi:hypothetical protein